MPGKGNLFDYAGNNPVSGSDPSGMDDCFGDCPDPPPDPDPGPPVFPPIPGPPVSTTGAIHRKSGRRDQLTLAAPTAGVDGAHNLESPNGPCNSAAVGFIRAHQADAATVARQLKVPTQNVLGLSGIESQWGTSNAATQANNFQWGARVEGRPFGL